MSYKENSAEKVRTEFEIKRKAAQDEADAKRNRIHLEIPEIEKIDRELANTGLRLYNCAINGEDIDSLVASMREKNAVLHKKRAELLAAHGYSPDYTKVKYDCEVCNDTGYDGIRFCDCYKKALIKEAYLSSGLGGLLSEQGFDNFSLSNYCDKTDEKGKSERDTMKTILSAAQKYAKDFGTFPNDTCKNLIFFGSTGLGKTHISTSIAKEVIEKGYSVVYDTASNILSRFEDEKFRNYKNGKNETEKYLSCDLLIIDDLGAEFHSQFTESALYNLINTRICADKPMIVSTNLNDGKLLKKTYSDRITSRLVGEFRAFCFVGSDIRLKRRKAGRIAEEKS